MLSWLWSRSKEKPRGEPPKFVVPLEPQKVKHGDKVVLETIVRGQPTPKVIWYHLDKEVVPSPEFVQKYDTETGKVSLTVSEIFIDDKGLYRCVAVNQYGRDETVSYVTVEDIEMLEKCELRQAPRITLPLEAQIIKKGTPIDLLARYEAYPPPTIKWYHQSKELKPSRDYIIEHTDDETSLHIEEIFEDDCGEYEVKIFNEAGEARSVASVLVTMPEEVVEMIPPRFTKTLQPQIVPEGEVAILEAEVVAQPEAIFKWYRHGQEITHDEELEVQITSEDNKTSLVLGELFEDDSGDYTVSAQNPVGKASSTATLLVEGEGDEESEPPVFNPPLTPIRVMDGEEVRFKCKVTGKPMPKITWLQNGRPIAHHREVRTTQTPDGKAGLQILEVFPEDEGDYTCIARNKAGEARTTANLTVEAYEYLPDSEQATIASISEKNILSGSPSDEEETVEIEKDSSESETSEAGSSPYFCNRLEETITVKEGTFVRLLAKANGYPRPAIKWYVDGAPVEVSETLTVENYEDGSTALTLPKTQLDDCGIYTCEAMNRNGIDTTITTLVVIEEHTESSKSYRKPEWVSRMEDLKENLAGIVERSHARRSGLNPQHLSSSKPDILLQCSSVMTSTPPKFSSTLSMSQSTTSVYQSLPPLMHSTPIMMQSSPSVLQSSSYASMQTLPISSPIILPELSVTAAPQKPIVHSVDCPKSIKPDSDTYIPHALSSSVGSVSGTCMSLDSLERPSVSQYPSCMSSRDTLSEFETEFDSHTDIDYRSDSQCTELHGDRLAQLEVASSLSIGDLSMGSDSVFISETETVSDGASRRPSGYAINPIYLTDDHSLNISKSSLLSPNTKHVHFKFDANTPSTTSEDEHSTESPNFAQAVLTNYLSSHRNSISQVIEALSSLAQADITAEIEMTIEQNKKDRQSNTFSKPNSEISAYEINPESIPSIEITEPNVSARVDDSVVIDFPASENETNKYSYQNICEIDMSDTYEFKDDLSCNKEIKTLDEPLATIPSLTSHQTSTSKNERNVDHAEVSMPEAWDLTKNKESENEKALNKTNTSTEKVHRKSILKNPGIRRKDAIHHTQEGVNESLKMERRISHEQSQISKSKPGLKKNSIEHKSEPNRNSRGNSPQKNSIEHKTEPNRNSRGNSPQKNNIELKSEPKRNSRGSSPEKPFIRTRQSNENLLLSQRSNKETKDILTVHRNIKSPNINKENVKETAVSEIISDSSNTVQEKDIVIDHESKESTESILKFLSKEIPVTAPTAPPSNRKEWSSPSSKILLPLSRGSSTSSLNSDICPLDKSDDLTQEPLISHQSEKSISAPCTPASIRKEKRPTPPSKLPLLMSRESSSDTLKDSNPTSRNQSNDSTPTSSISKIESYLSSRKSSINSLPERSTSAPATPVFNRRDKRPSPPSKLPLVMSRESSTESLRESRIPRFYKTNEFALTSGSKAVRSNSLKIDDSSTRIPKILSRELSSSSLPGRSSTKRNVWSEPSSPLSTPQMIRKTFKQIHESTKIPMPIYQYSSTEDLEDSSPDSPRNSRNKQQRSLIRPPRALSVDRAMEIAVQKGSDEKSSPSTSIPSRTQSPLPVLPRMHSPSQSKGSSRVQSPVINRISSPVSARSQTSSQSSSQVTSPGSTPRTVISPGSTPKTIISPSSTPKGLQSPSSTPKTFESPVSTPKRVQSPILQSPSSDISSKSGARPKSSRESLSTVKEFFTNRTPSKKSHYFSKYISASDSEQHDTPTSSGKKSNRNSKNNGLRRADSLEEFLLLENECME